MGDNILIPSDTERENVLFGMKGLSGEYQGRIYSRAKGGHDPIFLER